MKNKENKENKENKDNKKKYEHWEMYVINCDKVYIKLIESKSKQGNSYNLVYFYCQQEFKDGSKDEHVLKLSVPQWNTFRINNVMFIRLASEMDKDKIQMLNDYIEDCNNADSVIQNNDSDWFFDEKDTKPVNDDYEDDCED